jgi:translation initiation factor eIF-2B subunit delta
VILTYSYNEAVSAVLTKAASQGKDFRVFVVDSRPYLEGKQLLKELQTAGIKCTYMLVTSVSYHMKEVTRVLVGAIGLASNGALVSLTGTGMVCCIANVFKVPVLVVSESYKFSERVQIDSICYNELGDPDLLVSPQMYRGDTRVETRLANWRQNHNLVLLNLNFDVTLTEQISMLITEVGCVPVTSVPVILREYRKDTQNAEQARLFFDREVESD